MFEAARVGDGIEHTSALAGFLVGAVIGVALIATVAFCTFTCGFGAPLLLALAANVLAFVDASMILSLCEAKGASMTSKAGAIANGSPNVFINARPAAYAILSSATCTKHSPQQLVAEGSTNVFVNGQPAARIGDSTTCGAKVSEGSRNVFIGGGRKPYLPIDKEIPDWLRTCVDWAFTLAGLVGGLARMVVEAGAVPIRALLPCAVKYIAIYAMSEAVGRVVSGLVGNPVQVSTGRKLLLADGEIDFALIAPLPIVAARFYASDLDASSALGQGWRLPWELSLRVGEDAVVFTDSQGREIPFPLVPQGEKLYAPAEQIYLSHLPDGRWVVSSLDELHYAFGPAPQGAAATHLLARIEDNRARFIDIARDGNGEVCQLADAVGHRLSLHFEGFGAGEHAVRRLVRIERTAGGPVGDLVRYRYDVQGRLIAVIDALERQTRAFGWGASGAEAGLMIEHVNALGLSCRYRWEVVAGAPRVVAHSTSDGESYRFDYDFAAGRACAHDVSEPDRPATAEWAWDSHRQIVRAQDFDGRSYAMEYDALGQLVRLDLPAEPDAPRTVLFDYDELGRIVAETDPEGLRTVRAFAPDSLRLQEETLPDGATWRAFYEPHTGVPLKTRDALGQETEYVWENLDGPAAVVDPQGNVVRLEWNRRGQPSVHTDCSGNRSRYVYDDAGQFVAYTDALDQTTRVAVDALGQPVEIVHPDGSVERFVWDPLGQVVAHTDTAGSTRSWQRNARGQVERYTDAAGRALDAHYNRRRQLIGLTQGAAAYRFVLDPLGRLLGEQRPDGIAHWLTYNAPGWLVRRDERGSGPERPQRTAWYDYDRNGRLTAHHSADASTRYAWSAAGYLERVERTPTERGLGLGLDAQTLRFAYDPLGRLLAETGGQGTLGYAWDRLSNLQALTLPTGERLSYLRYGSGHVHGLQIDGQDLAQFERDGLHREILRTQGPLARRTEYDARGRIARQAAGAAPDGSPAVIERRYRYSAAGELERLQDSLRGEAFFAYDRAGRLLRRASADPAPGYDFERFAWDAADNLLQAPDGNAIDGHRLLDWRPASEHPQRHDYDPFGRLVAKRTAAGEQRYTWDADDRLLAVANPQGTTRFGYDPLGRRILKHHVPAALGADDGSGAYAVRFIWDGLRLLQEIAEPTRGPAAIRTWVYDPADPAGYVPLACCDRRHGADPDAPLGPLEIHYVHTDALGTPQELTDAAGQIAWSARYGAWGRRLGPADVPEGLRAARPTNCNLRFPGQYADAETRLHYNTFRYYDPDTGRFVSPDPIGLAGGLNLYRYAPNPTGWSDPWGWECWSTARRNFWKNEAKTNASAYSPANLLRMEMGKAARITAQVLKGEEKIIKDVSIELHHFETPQRIGGDNVHNVSNLKNLTPWAHEAVDKFRHTGEELIQIIKGIESW